MTKNLFRSSLRNTFASFYNFGILTNLTFMQISLYSVIYHKYTPKSLYSVILYHARLKKITLHNTIIRVAYVLS